MTLGWTLLIALVAGFAGGLGAGSAESWVRSRLERRRASRGTTVRPPDRPPPPEEPAAQLDVKSHRGQPSDEAATQLDVKNLRSDLLKIRETIERVQSDVSVLAARLPKPAEVRTGAPASIRPRSVPPVEPEDPWRAAISPRTTARLPDASPAVARAEPAPVAAGPPANAIKVEARDDKLVASQSYPPEAWLELRGPASGELTLNPDVKLNEYSLRRLSTFFHWESERPGATYETMRPAQIQWDEGRKTGTVVERGTARPR